MKVIKGEWVKVVDSLNVDLPVGTKVIVEYEDTSIGNVCKLSTVIKDEEWGNYFDNGYGNPIFDVISYVIVE